MRQGAAILLLVAILTPGARADSLGRLFFTPEQRTQLDREYARRMMTDSQAFSIAVLNGIVQKNGGPRTVWVDGMPQSADSSKEQLPDVHTVIMRDTPHPVELKVGQHLLPVWDTAE